MNQDILKATAEEIVRNGRGILAADESFPTIGKRFDTIGVENTEVNRRAYRQMLFTTEGAGEYVGGVILFDETLRQATTADGKPFAELLAEQGIVPGIKVDAGAKEMACHQGEKITNGLDGLRDRLIEYKALGARFAKWRAVLTIDGDDLPSEYCIRANASALTRYALICQEQGIVPIVEPEVLMDADNSIEVCDRVTRRALNALFEDLKAAGVYLPGILLKPNMVIAGKQCSEQASPQQVAEMTVACLKDCVPAEVPGIVFLSGGQTEEQATEHLDLMNKMGGLPWVLSFSYGRALQASALKTWLGKEENIAAAQQAYAHRARCNYMAASGKYDTAMDKAA